MSTRTAIVVAIGNSDDKLTQQRWSDFWAECNELISAATRYHGTELHGTWLSPPMAPFQNAGWSMSFEVEMLHLARHLQFQLMDVLRRFNQDSMAWTVGQTKLVPAASGGDVCSTCNGGIHLVNAPSGSWWAHYIHPDDDHDAEPRERS